MKKLILAVTVVVMMMTMVVGCSNDKTKDSGKDEENVTVESQENDQVDKTTNENELDDSLEGIQADIVINIEGFVTEIDGNRVTLDTGKVVIITDDTLFETQVKGGPAVKQSFIAGPSYL